MKNVLILSATASAINYKNSLKDRSDLKLYFTDISPYACSFYEEAVNPVLVPRSRDLAAYGQALNRIIAELEIDYFLPTSDLDMESVAALLQDGWRPDAKMFDFDPELFFTYTHKYKVVAALQGRDFAVPELYTEEAPKFPCVIKPSREGGSKGVWVIQNETEYKERAQEVKRLYGDDLVVQEFVPGDTGSIFVVLLLYGNDGKLYGQAVSYSTLTFMTWGGGGNAGMLMDNPELIAEATRIVDFLGGWKGPINVEFKRSSENGRYYLMEINARLNGYSYLTTMNGMNFPKAIIELLEDGTTTPLALDQTADQRNFIMNFREMPVDKFVDEGRALDYREHIEKKAL